MWVFGWLSFPGPFSQKAQDPFEAAEVSVVDHLQRDTGLFPNRDTNYFPNGIFSDHATKSPASDQPAREQSSPFLRLPPELRLAIYDFVLQDNLDDIIARGKASRDLAIPFDARTKPLLPFLGALAILHTSRALRIEGADVIRSLAEAKHEQLSQGEIRMHAELDALPEPTNNETCDLILETTARYDATRAMIDDSDRLLKAIRKVARAELLSRLSRLRVEYDWSAGDHWQKRQVISQWVWDLSDADSEALYDPDVGDQLDYLVGFVDSGVGMRGREEPFVGEQRSLDQVQLGLFHTRDGRDSE